MNIEQLMTRNAAVCRSGDHLGAPAKIMWEHDCGCVPVVDGEYKVVGVITDRDICMAAYTQNLPLERIQVKDAMANVVFTCGPDQTIEVAMELMRRHQLRRLPVVDAAGHLVGLLSLNDVALEAARERGLASHGVTAGDVGSTLAAISKHRDSALVHAEAHALALIPAA